MWAIRDEDSSSEIVPAFERCWCHERAKVPVKEESDKYVNCSKIFAYLLFNGFENGCNINTCCLSLCTCVACNYLQN